MGKSMLVAVDVATFQRNPEYAPAYPWGRALAIAETLLTSTCICAVSPGDQAPIPAIRFGSSAVLPTIQLCIAGREKRRRNPVTRLIPWEKLWGTCAAFEKSPESRQTGRGTFGNHGSHRCLPEQITLPWAATLLPIVYCGSPHPSQTLTTSQSSAWPICAGPSRCG